MAANIVGMIHLLAACKERLARADRAEGLSPFQRDEAEWEAYQRGEVAALRWMIQMLEAAADEALGQEPHSSPDSVEGG